MIRSVDLLLAPQRTSTLPPVLDPVEQMPHSVSPASALAEAVWLAKRAYMTAAVILVKRR